MTPAAEQATEIIRQNTENGESPEYTVAQLSAAGLVCNHRDIAVTMADTTGADGLAAHRITATYGTHTKTITLPAAVALAYPEVIAAYTTRLAELVRDVTA